MKKDKNLIPNSDKRILEQTPVITLLLLAKRDLTAFLATTLEMKKNEIISSIEYFADKDEKTLYLNNAIKETRESIEGDDLKNIYNLYQNNLAYIRKLASVYAKAKSDIVNVLPSEKKKLFEGAISYIIDMAASKKKFTKADMNVVLKHVKMLQGESKAIDLFIKAEKPVDALVFALLHIYYQKEYLQFLLITREEILQGPHKDTEIERNGLSKEFTTARQVLAVHYLMDELKVYGKTDKTEIAKLIQFLTGKETSALKISDTNIYKHVKSPLSKGDKSLDKDLRFVRDYFEKLGLQNIVNNINKEIDSKE